MGFKLRIVSVVLQRCNNVDMEHIASLVTRFLLPSPNLSLSSAVNFNSVELLDWIWEASCTSINARTPTWTLTNYLRSYQVYYRQQFRLALTKATELDSLKIVKWLFAHFSWCVVLVEVIDLATGNGSRDILQFLVDYDGEDPSKMNEFMRHQISTISPVAGENIIIKWSLLSEAAASAVAKDDIDIVWWLFQQAPYQRSTRRTNGLSVFVKYYLKLGDVEHAASFLPPGNGFDYARSCPFFSVIEAMMKRGYYTEKRKMQLLMHYRFWRLKGDWTW